MMIFVYISTALRQLRKNIGRSILTMLGIIIGIGSVIFILTMGEVAKNFLLGQISQFGTNVLEIFPQGSIGPGGGSIANLTTGDVEALKTQTSLFPDIVQLDGAYSSTVPLQYDTKESTVSVVGSHPQFLQINNLQVVEGRIFTQSEIDNHARVVVLDEKVAQDLFSYQNPIGERVKLKDTTFTVIGVVQSINSFGFAPQFVYSPITTVKQFFAPPEDSTAISFVLIEFASGTDVASLTNRVRYVLYSRHDITTTDAEPFQIVSREQALGIFNTILIGIQAFISAVAGISLVVGGIGIMNIMLVTVKERTKEIGLRKAIGAHNNSILFQFLIEAVVLTTVGGIIGIALGLGLSMVLVLIAHALQPTWGIEFVFVPSAIALACGVAFIVGVVFGLYPAWKASRLHPIEALRWE